MGALVDRADRTLPPPNLNPFGEKIGLGLRDEGHLQFHMTGPCGDEKQPDRFPCQA